MLAQGSKILNFRKYFTAQFDVHTLFLSAPQIAWSYPESPFMKLKSTIPWMLAPDNVLLRAIKEKDNYSAYKVLLKRYRNFVRQRVRELASEEDAFRLQELVESILWVGRDTLPNYLYEPEYSFEGYLYHLIPNTYLNFKG
jgi:hypothetical protein